MGDNPRIEELRRRVLADPASIAFAALAEEYRRSGNYAEAIETCRVGLQRHPSYLSARVTLGRSLMETAQYGEARKELELVLKSAPENLAAIRGLAEIHEREASLPEPEPIKLAPVASQPAAAASSPVATAAATSASASITAKAITDAGVAEWTLPPKGPDPVPVRQAVPVIPAPVVISMPDPAIARLEQFLVAIRSARASSRISR
jgi:tetratricopeptide (TPR) repeat protein